MGTTSETIDIRQAVSKAALLSLSISATACNINEVTLESFWTRTSDKYLTEHCSLLNNLVPGDTVLADRGFDISDSVGLYCSSLKIPAFTGENANSRVLK